MTRRRMITLLATLTMVIGIHHSMLAANRELCRFYADSALDAQRINKAMCRIAESPRFSSDRQHHELWCQGAMIESIENESADRMNELDGCNKAAMCENYADTAKELSDQNVGLKCGYSGGRWGTDLTAHKDWCMSQDKEAAYNETRGRFADMDHCTTCDLYAAEALRYVDLRARSKCGAGTGPRWSRDRQVHFGWCMGARLSSLAPEQQARADEVAGCNR